MRSCTTRRAPSAGSPRRRVHEGGSNNGLLDTRALSSTEPARLYGMRAYDIDAWPLARAKERGRPEQCQLRGGGRTRKRVRNGLAAGAVLEPIRQCLMKRSRPEQCQLRGDKGHNALLN